MAKKIQAYIKLQVKAGEANPSPPVGPALGYRAHARLTAAPDGRLGFHRAGTGTAGCR